MAPTLSNKANEACFVLCAKVTSLIVQTSSQKCIVTYDMSDTVRCVGTGMMIRA